MNKMFITSMTKSHKLSLSETLAQLKVSDKVDGLALFGSRTEQPSPVSDYDLLILVKDSPIHIFQMLTHINGRMADVVFVETDVVDRLLDLNEAVRSTSIEGMLMLKSQKAQIVYDRSGRLERTRQYTLERMQSKQWLPPTPESSLYNDWFWQNHLLFHIKRMIQSDDPIYQTAVDMMLTSGLSDVYQVYYRVHNLPWQGEKEAIRYWQLNDPNYLKLLQACFSTVDRNQKVELYEQVVRQTISSIGPMWKEGITAVYLKDTTLHPAQISEALQFWETLFGK